MLAIGARSPRLTALLVLFFALVSFFRHKLFVLLFLDLRQLVQCLDNTLFLFLSDALTGRTPTLITGVGVGLDLALKRFDLCLGFFQTALTE